MRPTKTRKNPHVGEEHPDFFVGESRRHVPWRALTRQERAQAQLGDFSTKELQEMREEDRDFWSELQFRDSQIRASYPIYDHKSARAGRQSRAKAAKGWGDAAFRKWFGDSVVVDEKGGPLVVYHGTTRGGFDSFDLDEIDKHHNGFFFSSNKGLALTYTKDRQEMPGPVMSSWDDIQEYVEGGTDDLVIDERYYVVYDDGNASPLYRSEDELREDHEEEIDDGAILTGYVVGSPGMRDVEVYPDDEDSVSNAVSVVQDYIDENLRGQNGVYAVYLRMVDPLIVDAKGANWDAIPFFGEDEDGISYHATTDDITHEARDIGHDGVIIKDVYDSGGHGHGTESGDVYVVFDPHQIKSATVNTGAYSSDTPSIRNPSRHRRK